MNKTDLIAKTAELAGVPKKDATAVINALFEPSKKGPIAAPLKGGDRVTIPGFGTFEARKREARTGRNPQTGKEIKIKARTVPAFRAGKSLKDSVGK